MFSVAFHLSDLCEVFHRGLDNYDGRHAAIISCRDQLLIYHLKVKVEVMNLKFEIMEKDVLL